MKMGNKGTILYIGGYELPDKNAAAQRVIGIAKGLRELGYDVIFLNSLKNAENADEDVKTYFGFKCYEYGRESDRDYLFSAQTALDHIKKIRPDYIIAYNYPGFALEKIRRYCQKNDIKCIADATEWYKAASGNIIYRLIKTIDTSYRMQVVQKKLDGVIAISRFLYEYYKPSVKTVKIPPTVDIADCKWNTEVKKYEDTLAFFYAGSPSAQKERLDLVVDAIEKLSSEKTIRFDIVGITKEQFIRIYGWNKAISERIVFRGRVEHSEAIELTKMSDWTIILRDNNWVVNAGFPTKLVESITCGIPVLINDFSNIDEYVNESNGIVIGSIEKIDSGLQLALTATMSVTHEQFDYHNFLSDLDLLFA